MVYSCTVDTVAQGWVDEEEKEEMGKEGGGEDGGRATEALQ